MDLPAMLDAAQARADETGLPTFVVICGWDGNVRHDTPFDWAADAGEFANWGHCCTTDHEVRPVKPAVPQHVLHARAAAAGLNWREWERSDLLDILADVPSEGGR